MYTVYFLGCYYTRSPHLSNLETYFLNLALHGLASTFVGHERTVDLVRASSLLAIYFYSTGQIAEGYRHSVSGAQLALGIGLHRTCFPEFSGGFHDLVIHTSADMNDRISAFWQIFMVDTAGLRLPDFRVYYQVPVIIKLELKRLYLQAYVHFICCKHKRSCPVTARQRRCHFPVRRDHNLTVNIGTESQGGCAIRRSSTHLFRSDSLLY